MVIFRICLTVTACLGGTTALHAQYGESAYKVPPGMIKGGAYIDRFLPMTPNSPLTSEVWGIDAVKPRDAKNGIEDAEYSYWCNSIAKGKDGKFHNFVVRWREDSAKGHFEWPNSIVVHTVGDTPTGPFKVVSEIGKGHNVNAYQAKDGTWILYVIGGCYRAPSLDGPWTRGKLSFDNRGRKDVNMSNCTFTRREDGSYLMISRTGIVWISKDGNQEPFRRVTTKTMYPPVKGSEYEDPVVWHDNTQYNLIVNDWFGRTAYYLRSRDGVKWTWDQGRAYAPGIFRHEDGTLEDWHKIERPNVLQDQLGRATHMYFAVIDDAKEVDKPKDNHSSKNIAIPVTVGRDLSITNQGETFAVEIRAENGFNPHTDVDGKSLQFGAPSAIDFGKGAKPQSLKKHGTSLVAIFDISACGFTANDPVGKLLGTTNKGKLLFGYAPLPGEPGSYPIVSADGNIRTNRTSQGELSLTIQFDNFGLAASKAMQAQLTIRQKGRADLNLSATAPPLAPYEGKEVTVVIPTDKITTEVPADLEIRLGKEAAEESMVISEIKIP